MPVAGLVRDTARQSPQPTGSVLLVGGGRRRTTTDRMTQSMMKTILLALLTFSMRTGAASAQSRTFYDTQKADH